MLSRAVNLSPVLCKYLTFEFPQARKKKTSANRRYRLLQCRKCKKRFDRSGRRDCHQLKCLQVNDDETVFKCHFCKESFRSKRALQRHKKEHGDAVLSFAKINSTTFLVRKQQAGTGHPVYCSVKEENGSISYFCHSTRCHKDNNRAIRSRSTPALCPHLRSIQVANNCLSANNPSCDELKEKVRSYKEITREHRAVVLKHIQEAAIAGETPIVRFKPSSSTEYFAVFEPKTHYYVHERRITVSYDMINGIHTCQCKNRGAFCVHKTIVRSFLNIEPLSPVIAPDVTPPEPSQPSMGSMSISSETSSTLETRKKIKTLLERYKTSESMIQMDNFVKEKDFFDIIILIPNPSACQNCGSSSYKTKERKHKLHSLTLDNKKRVIIQHTYCNDCDTELWYCSFKDGIYNYNNSSLFTVELMESIAGAYETTKKSIQEHFGEMTRTHKKEYTYASYLNAYWTYAGLKIEFQSSDSTQPNMHCLDCGFYPRMLVGDVIQSFNFSTNHRVIEKELTYSSVHHFKETLLEQDLAEALKTKDCKFVLSGSFPAFICPENCCEGPPPVLRRTKAAKKPPLQAGPNIPLQKLYDLASSGDNSKLKELSRELGLGTHGTRDEIIRRISDQGDEVQFEKIFPRVYGRSGGVLRLSCPCGIVYALKVLTRSEGASDYAEILLSFKYAPTLFVVDFAPTVVATMENHMPLFFAPNNGRFGDPKDARLLEKLNENVEIDEREKISLPFLSPSFLFSGPVPYGANPTTGERIHLCAMDTFHVTNKIYSDSRVLQDCRSVRQLNKTNTAVAEQKNNLSAVLKGHAAQMSPHHFIKFCLARTFADNLKINTKLRYDNRLKKRVMHPYYGFLVDEGTPLDPIVFLPPTIAESINTNPKTSIQSDQVFNNKCNPATGTSTLMPGLINKWHLSWFNTLTAIIWYTNLIVDLINPSNYGVPYVILRYWTTLVQSNTSNQEYQYRAADRVLKLVPLDSANNKLTLGEEQCCVSVLKTVIFPMIIEGGVHAAWTILERTDAICERTVSKDSAIGVDFLFLEISRQDSKRPGNKLRHLEFKHVKDYVNLYGRKFQLVAAVTHSDVNNQYGALITVSAAQGLQWYQCLDSMRLALSSAGAFLKKAQDEGVLFVYRLTNIFITNEDISDDLTPVPQPRKRRKLTEDVKQLSPLTLEELLKLHFTTNLCRPETIDAISVAGFKVHKNELMTLIGRTWLSGIIMDAVITKFSHIANNKSFSIVECTVLANLINIKDMNGMNICNRTNRSVIFSKDIITAFNMDNSHWILLIILKKKIIILDPILRRPAAYLQLVRLLDKVHIFKLGQSLTQAGYTICIPDDVHIQTNATECGVYVLLFVYSLLLKKDIKDSFEKMNDEKVAKQFRLYLHNFLILSSTSDNMRIQKNRGLPSVTALMIEMRIQQANNASIVNSRNLITSSVQSPLKSHLSTPLCTFKWLETRLQNVFEFTE